MLLDAAITNSLCGSFLGISHTFLDSKRTTTVIQHLLMHSRERKDKQRGKRMIQIPASNQTQKHMWQCGPVSPIWLPTPVVNFINMLRTIFSYEHCFSSFFYVHVTKRKRRSYKKFAHKMLMKLTTTKPTLSEFSFFKLQKQLDSLKTNSKPF